MNESSAPKSPTRNEFEDLWEDIGQWSDSAFGRRQTPVGIVNHLAREVLELIESGAQDVEEYADCFMLIVDAARVRGLTPGALLRATREKLEKNRRRKWGAVQPDGVIEHE